MEVFIISEYTIDKLKKKRILTVIFSVIISMIIWGSLSFFVMKDTDIRVFAIALCLSIILISSLTFFSLRYSIRLLIEKLKNVQYIIENERIIMKQNALMQYTFSINEIMCINRYKNNEVIITLNTDKKIAVNNYIDNFDKFIDKLNTISRINIIDKKPKLDLNNVNLTKLISVIILITLISISRIIVNIFNINIPKVDRHDPMVLLVEILPILILAVFSALIGREIDKRIKNKKYIIILFFSIEIVFLIIFLGGLFLKSFAVGFSITIIMLFLLLIQVIFLFINIRTENKKKNNN